MIDWDTADRITMLTLTNYRNSLQEHLDGGADGSRWLHPEDEVHNRAMIQAINFVVKETNLDKTNIQNTLQLFNEGATIPFIARYRKERTGGLDEIQIEQIREFSKF
jgi:hypothetical protein